MLTGGLLGLAPSVTAEASTAATIAAPVVPAALAVPAGNHVRSRQDAIGVQIYECGAAGTWTLHAPAATLRESASGRIALHFGGIDAGLPAGPYWQSVRDGSRVHGGSAVSAPSPLASAIPWLRLTALDTSGTGAFGGVTFIQRLDNAGGLAPAGTGDPAQKTLRPIPYTATYYFYAQD
jgi:hypothetical protein